MRVDRQSVRNKLEAILTFATLAIGLSCQQAEELPATLALPLTIQEGYGPYKPGFGILSAETGDYPKGTASGTSSQPVKDIPEHWTNRVKSRVVMNTEQFMYQNYCAGKIDTNWYWGLVKEEGWSTNASTLSKKPIKCSVYVIRGFDSQAGKWAVLVDTNNNLDVSDETIIYPEPQDIKGNNFDYYNPVYVTYEVFQQGQVVTRQVPMVVKTMMGDFVYNFPQHAKAVFKNGAKKYERLVSSAGFTSLDYESAGPKLSQTLRTS
ncbi:hypothetical protein GCM10027347_49430 [Larkinella harenae]